MTSVTNVFQCWAMVLFMMLLKKWFWIEVLELPPLALGSMSWTTLAFDYSFLIFVLGARAFTTSSLASLGLSCSLLALTLQRISASKKSFKPGIWVQTFLFRPLPSLFLTAWRMLVQRLRRYGKTAIKILRDIWRDPKARKKTNF